MVIQTSSSVKCKRYEMVIESDSVRYWYFYRPEVRLSIGLPLRRSVHRSYRLSAIALVTAQRKTAAISASLRSLREIKSSNKELFEFWNDTYTMLQRITERTRCATQQAMLRSNIAGYINIIFVLKNLSKEKNRPPKFPNRGTGPYCPKISFNKPAKWMPPFNNCSFNKAIWSKL